MEVGPRTLLAMMAAALPPSRPTRRKPDLPPSPAGEKRLMKYKYPPHRAAMHTSPSICEMCSPCPVCETQRCPVACEGA